MNTHVINFNSLLQNLDCSNNLIKITADSFLDYITIDLDYGQDLVKLIFFHSLNNELNSLKYVYLSNEIVIRVHKLISTKFFKEEHIPSLKETLNGILEVQVMLSESDILSDKDKKEIEKILTKWGEKSIFKKEKIREIKLNLIKQLDYPLQSFTDKAFLNLYRKNLITIPSNTLKYSSLLEKLNSDIDADENNNDLNKEDPSIDDNTEKEDHNKDKNIEKQELIKLTNEIIASQIDIYKNRILSIDEIDNLLLKIDEIKIVN